VLRDIASRLASEDSLDVEVLDVVHVESVLWRESISGIDAESNLGVCNKSISRKPTTVRLMSFATPSFPEGCVKSQRCAIFVRELERFKPLRMGHWTVWSIAFIVHLSD
jgi:hypothetical protein